MDTPSTLQDTPLSQQPLNFKQWALYIFLAGIPFVGLILLLLWAFGNEGNVHRKSWAKGMLLIMLIVFILTVLLYVLIGASLLAAYATQ